MSFGAGCYRVPNQHDDVPVDPEPVLVDEDEDPKEEKLEEEEDLQEEEDDMENGFSYPSTIASESETDDEKIEVEDAVESEIEIVPVSVYEVGESSTTAIPREDGDSLLPGFIRRDIDSLFGRILILDLGNEVRSSVEQGTDAMEKLVERLGNTEDKVECKKLKNELEEERLSNTFLRMQNERARLREILNGLEFELTEFYQEMIESVDAAITAERARWFEKTESVFEISECVEGKKVKFAAVTLEEPALTWWKTKVATVGLETVKEYDVVAYTQRFNELALMCPRMVEHEKGKVDAYIWGLTDNIKLVRAIKRITLANFEKNSQKQGNARAMVTAHTDGKLPLCKRCFTRHVGQCTIKCHKCGKVGHKERYCKEKSVATGANAQLVWTCYDCGEQGLNVVTENKSKEKRMEDVPVICDFPEVFPEELSGLPPPRQVEFQTDLVPRAAPVAHWTNAPAVVYGLDETGEEGAILGCLKIILELLKKERFGVHVDLAKIEAIKKDELSYRVIMIVKFGIILENYVCGWTFESESERDKPLRVRALMMTVHNDLPKQIREAQKEEMKKKYVRKENLRRLIKPILEFRPDGSLLLWISSLVAAIRLD
ncbi:putative reverse transcriptase domain-containing protein [Tanacetum coccineum]|uniref:Reverse transcriptase domain-containing protein n=1 Tax=Tanacetum coccineum TaxID=301880 RepID=A0ABQ5CEH5_9ASTR